MPSVAVIDQDSVTAILENGRGRAQFCDMAVLDFASFTTPGGGYTRGSVAQEESLCAESYLYNVLKSKDDWYGENRRRNINCNLYKNRPLVAPPCASPATASVVPRCRGGGAERPSRARGV